MLEIRHLPHPNALVEVTCRTFQARFLLRPSQELEEIVAGVLARAHARFPVDLIAVTCLSNHVHLLLCPKTQFLLSMFMGYFKRNVTKEVQRLHGWTGSVWDGPYRAIPLEDSDWVHIERFKYLLAQGIKEHLVSRVVDWPSLHFGKTILRGKTHLSGVWINRTKECQARNRNRKKEITRADLEEPTSVPLAKLPCWAHLSWPEYRRKVQDLVMQIEAKAASEREREGIEIMGAWKLERRHPHHWPEKAKKSFAPPFHAGSRNARIEMYQAYGWFLAEYREAADLLKDGHRTVEFPEGCFPPALPYAGQTGLPPDPG